MADMRRRAAGMLEFIGRTQVEMVEAEEEGGEMRGLVDGRKGRARGEGEFGELNLLEMMDVLTGELVKWQKAFT